MPPDLLSVGASLAPGQDCKGAAGEGVRVPGLWGVQAVQGFLEGSLALGSTQQPAWEMLPPLSPAQSRGRQGSSRTCPLTLGGPLAHL